MDSGPVISRPRSRQHPVNKAIIAPTIFPPWSQRVALSIYCCYIPAMVLKCCPLDLLLLRTKPGELTVVHWPERPACVCVCVCARLSERERDRKT